MATILIIDQSQSSFYFPVGLELLSLHTTKSVKCLSTACLLAYKRIKWVNYLEMLMPQYRQVHPN